MKKHFLSAAFFAMLSCSMAWAETTHKIQAGETLESIATKYGVTVEAIKKANPRTVRYVYAGMVLTIPDLAPAAAPVVEPEPTPAPEPEPVIAPATAPAPTVIDDIDPDMPALPAPTPAPTAADDIDPDMPAMPAPAAAAASGKLMLAEPNLFSPDMAARQRCRSGEVICEYGDPNVMLRDEEVSLSCDFAYTTIEGKESIDQYLERRGKDWVRDWPETQRRALTRAGIELWTTNRKKGGLIYEAKHANQFAPIHIMFCPDDMDMGSTGASIAASMFTGFTSRKTGGAIFTGSVIIYDATTGEPLCSFYANQVKGNGQDLGGETARIGDVFSAVVRAIMKTVRR